MKTQKKLSLSPILFHWSAEKQRDFYFQVADEIPVDIVYLGHVNCPKWHATSMAHLDAITNRLQAAGKEVVLSTLALVQNERADACVKDAIRLSEQYAIPIEVNDISTFHLLQEHRDCLVIGPFINIYNEDTLAYFNGVKRICLPFELSAQNIDALGKTTDIPIEMFVWGRVPLSISARCFHAKAYDVEQKKCGMPCRNEADGLNVCTLDNQDFLSVSGHMVLSDYYRRYTNVKNINVEVLRISPHNTDMKMVVDVYRRWIQNDIQQQEADELLDVT